MSESIIDNTTWWLSICSLSVGFFISILGFCYKSKCQKISFCGLKIERNVLAELREHEIEMRTPHVTPPITPQVSITPIINLSEHGSIANSIV